MFGFRGRAEKKGERTETDSQCKKKKWSITETREVKKTLICSRPVLVNYTSNRPSVFHLSRAPSRGKQPKQRTTPKHLIEEMWAETKARLSHRMAQCVGVTLIWPWQVFINTLIQCWHGKKQSTWVLTSGWCRLSILGVRFEIEALRVYSLFITANIFHGCRRPDLSWVACRSVTQRSFNKSSA